MRTLLMLTAVALAIAAAGCGGDDDGSAGDATTGGQATTETAAAEEASAECQAAMEVYHLALEEDAMVDEGPLQEATLTACSSREEWLSAVAPYTSGEACIACADPDEVYEAMCGDRMELPACKE